MTIDMATYKLIVKALARRGIMLEHIKHAVGCKSLSQVADIIQTHGHLTYCRPGQFREPVAAIVYENLRDDHPELAARFAPKPGLRRPAMATVPMDC